MNLWKQNIIALPKRNTAVTQEEIKKNLLDSYDEEIPDFSSEEISLKISTKFSSESETDEETIDGTEEEWINEG